MSRNIEDLHPLVKDKFIKFKDLAKKEGINIILTDGYRSHEEQQRLYNKGRTWASRIRREKIVTNAKPGQSFHNYGVAFDVVPVENGKAIWNNHNHWNKLGEIGKKLGLEWGGDWKRFVDKPHFQYTQGISLADFAAGKTLTTPDDKVAPWAKDAWKKAKKKKVLSENSIPTDKLTKQELMMFFDRLKLL